MNPRQTVGDIIAAPMVLHGICNQVEAEEKARELLAKVGLQPSYASRYPHEFSGGQRQRIGIARAVALKPDFVVCDEAVSALDVSVQAQIINLLLDLKDEFGLSYLFIAHDLSVVRHISEKLRSCTWEGSLSLPRGTPFSRIQPILIHRLALGGSPCEPPNAQREGHSDR